MGAVAHAPGPQAGADREVGDDRVLFLASSSRHRRSSTIAVRLGDAVPDAGAVSLSVRGYAAASRQILLTESYRHADMSVVAPFEYTSLIFSIIIGFIAFGDVPTWQMLVGGLIVIGSAPVHHLPRAAAGKGTAGEGSGNPAGLGVDRPRAFRGAGRPVLQ